MKIGTVVIILAMTCIIYGVTKDEPRYQKPGTNFPLTPIPAAATMSVFLYAMTYGVYHNRSGRGEAVSWEEIPMGERQFVLHTYETRSSDQPLATYVVAFSESKPNDIYTCCFETLLQGELLQGLYFVIVDDESDVKKWQEMGTVVILASELESGKGNCRAPYGHPPLIEG